MVPVYRLEGFQNRFAIATLLLRRSITMAMSVSYQPRVVLILGRRSLGSHTKVTGLPKWRAR